MSERQSEENGKLVIATQKAPQISISYSFVFSLYQYLIYLSHLSAESVDYPKNEIWQRVSDRVSSLYYDLGPLNFFEFPIAVAGTVSEVEETLRMRANLFVDELLGAINETRELYRETMWKRAAIFLSCHLSSYNLSANGSLQSPDGN